MAVAAQAAGIALTVNSGFRSDAEQAALFAAHPDPRWVAPPGHSLHRCATELDLGPDSAYGWLAANAAASASSSATPGRRGTTALTRPARRARRRATRSARPRPGRRDRRRDRGAAELRPRSFPGAAAPGRHPLERLRGAARRAADGGVELRPLRVLARRAPRGSPSSSPRPRPPTGSMTPSTPWPRSTPRPT